METIINGMILAGSLLMVSNIYQYIKFLVKSQGIMTGGKLQKIFLQDGALVLLVLFLLGYLCVLFLGDPTLTIGGILFGGSIFVAIVETLMFKLIGIVQKNSRELSEALIVTIEARDPELNGHSLVVRDLAKLFYWYLPKRMRKEINPVSLEYAALLHDLGKFGVPETILYKPDRLNDKEWDVVRMHPKIGAEIVRQVSSFSDMSDWIEYHHEKVDGTGYYGISGDDIPLPARIIAVVDTYSVIRMSRSYKGQKSHEEAMEIINAVAGTQLDAELVTYFSAIPEHKIEKCVVR